MVKSHLQHTCAAPQNTRVCCVCDCYPQALTTSNRELAAAADTLRAEVAEVNTQLAAARTQATEAAAREAAATAAAAAAGAQRDAAVAAAAAVAAERDALAAGVAQLSAIKDAAAAAGLGLVELAQMSSQVRACLRVARVSCEFGGTRKAKRRLECSRVVLFGVSFISWC